MNESGMIQPTWQKGDITLYLGDCMDILPHLSGVDAVITDPPYGINIGGAKSIGGAGEMYEATEYGKHEWDKSGLTYEQYLEIRKTAQHFIIWGWNHLADVIGKSHGCLVWDKKCQNGWNDTFSDAEIAATNTINNTKAYRHLWVGALRKSGKDEKKRHHPTQKPVLVMAWCIEFVPKAEIICDPFMGSGTTGIACIRSGRKFIGIEKDPKYFEIARDRIEKELAQLRLF